MTYAEITRKLRRCGCEFDREAKGSHKIWINPAIRKRTTIQDWGSKDLPNGTLAGILRDLDISRQDFNRA